MNLRLYCKNSDKKLIAYDVNNVDTIEMARQHLLEHFHTVKIVYFEPILCVVQGGKKT